MRALASTTMTLVAALSFTAGVASAAPRKRAQRPAASEQTTVSAAEAAEATEERPLRFSVSVNGASVRHLDDSYRVLGDADEQGAASVEATYELRAPGADRGLALGLGTVSEERGPAVGIELQRAKLRAVSYYALASLRFRRQRTVQPFVTLAAGLTRAEFTVLRSAGASLQGRDNGAFGRASGGLRLAPRWLTYRDRRGQAMFGAHVSLEAGLLLGTRLTFDVSPDVTSDTANAPAPIRVQSVSAGDVMPTALFGGLGVGVSF